MKVILLYVSSLDGKVTKWGQKNIYWWTSAEDVIHFRSTIIKNKLLVMGSNTFNAVHPKPAEGIRRIVLTREPEKYTKYAVPGQLEFMNVSPAKLIEQLEHEGYKHLLLVSGKTLSTEFLKKQLVNEIWLTIEPKIFGIGDSMVTEEKLNVHLQLIKLQKLNRKGTLLIKYKVEK